MQKRTHLCAVARGMEMFRGVQDMTPARFDLLYLIHKQVPRRGGKPAGAFVMYQAHVTRALGVSRQTIFKMVKRLIELGLLIKHGRGSGRRGNLLQLTEEGVLRTRQALNAAFTETPPLPREAPTTGVVPRYWRRPELADARRSSAKRVLVPEAPLPADASTTSDAVFMPAIFAELATVDTEASQRPPTAPSGATLKRWVEDLMAEKTPAQAAQEAARAYALREIERLANVTPKAKGREVAKIYSTFVSARLQRPIGKTGRRGRSQWYRARLEQLIDSARDIAQALGNTAENIYTFRFLEEGDH